MATVLCFRLTQTISPSYVTDAFSDEVHDNINRFGEDYIGYPKPNWNPTENASILTETLNQQAKHNAGLLHQHLHDCQDDEDKGWPNDLRRSSCQRFWDIVTAYLDVAYRDELALSPGHPERLYAVAALYRGVYYGHVYVWLSPSGEHAYMMGIRNRVDSIFLRGSSEERRGIAYLLLEGARYLSLIKGSRDLIVVAPFPIMIDVIVPLGFVIDHVPISLMGPGVYLDPEEFSQHLNGEYDVNVYRLSDLHRSFANLVAVPERSFVLTE